MSDKDLRYPAFMADWVVIAIYFALLAFGWFSICGASHEFGDTNFFDFGTRTGKQLMWIGLALVLGFTLLMTDDRYFDVLADFIYWVVIIILIITPFIAKDIKGSKSWISLGSVSLQPAEFAKCATALALAKMINRYGVSLDNTRHLLKAGSLVFLPMLLIVMQRETGSALVFLTFFLMFYREGMPGSILFTATAAIAYFIIGVRFSADALPHTHTNIGEFTVLLLIWLFTSGMTAVYSPRTPHARRLFVWGGVTTVSALLISNYVIPFDISWMQIGFVVGCSIYLFWQAFSERLGGRISKHAFIGIFALGSLGFLYASDHVLNNTLEPHQRTRVKVLLGMEENNSGAGYNVNQSKIAIGSGGLSGKGFMNGTQTKLKYVPEQDTDFIFCTVGEEQGFVGAAGVLLLFMLLILRLIVLAERQTTKFGRVYGYCVMSLFFFHVLINVGMVMGVMPVIGIPLPFFSYGGSSLWGFTLLLFTFLRIDAGDKKNRKKLK